MMSAAPFESLLGIPLLDFSLGAALGFWLRFCLGIWLATQSPFAV